MRKTLIFALLLVVATAGFSEGQPEGPYQDGIYYAQEDGFSHGWKYVVTIYVKNGAIVKADWNGVSNVGGPTKDVVSTAGKYPMVEAGGAQAPWHIQAERAEMWLVENQDPSLISYIDDEGHTDAISGVSVHVVEFFDLAQQALDAGPVGRGTYRDGYYSATMPEFERGYKYFVEITVVNGFIATADWNAIAEEDTRTKDRISAEGDYPMVENGGAQAPWHEQGALAEAWLVENQDPSLISYIDDEGHSDAITGVSIHVVEFFDLAEKALKWAKSK
jgi:major membrane immunogen (membrane-anchored lipoprotein)